MGMRCRDCSHALRMRRGQHGTVGTGARISRPGPGRWLPRRRFCPDRPFSLPLRFAPGGIADLTKDHKHRLRTVKPYEYTDAATLLAAFWKEVESGKRERGVWT